jgi:hypothetical protein
MSRFPSEQSDASEGPLSELGAVDRLIDLSLSEWLAGAVPTTSNASLPELVSKRSQQSVFSNAQLDRALDDARLDIEQIARSKVTRSTPRRNTWITFATIAASLAICSLIGWWNLGESNQQVAKESKRLSSDVQGIESPSKQATADLQANADDLTVENGQQRKPAMATIGDTEASSDAKPNRIAVNERSESNDKPAIVEKSAPSTPGNSIASKPETSKLVLGGPRDQEVISVIDSQFQQIWKQLGLLDASTKQRPLTAERTARLLLNRAPTSSELEAIRRESASIPRSADNEGQAGTVEQWILSDEFNRIWADRMAQFYIGHRGSTGESYNLFRDWIEEQIRQDIPIVEIQRQVLLGLFNQNHPAYFLANQWVEASQRSSGTSARWVGLSEAQSSRLKGLSRLFLNATGNVSIGCTECHGMQSDQSPNWLAGASSVGFDSIAALMVQASEPSRSELFTKEQDDRISKIPSRLPDGKRAGNELSTDQVIGRWVEQGSEAQSGLINSIWRDFFGQALHSKLGLDSGLATEDRKDLIEYLGKQVLEHRAGVRQIVYWMVMSEPGRSGQEALNFSQYMAMDSKKLQDYAMRLGVLNTVAIEPYGSQESSHKSIDTFASKLFPEQPDWLERSLLAQPAGQLGTPSESSKGTTRGASSDTESSLDLSFLRADLQYRFAGQQLRELARMLAESKLSDEQIVEHSYLMSKHRFPSDQELKAWKASSWAKSERSSSVLRLIVGIDNLAP